jgi:hypothetical protein
MCEARDRVVEGRQTLLRSSSYGVLIDGMYQKSGEHDCMHQKSGEHHLSVQILHILRERRWRHLLRSPHNLHASSTFLNLPIGTLHHSALCTLHYRCSSLLLVTVCLVHAAKHLSRHHAWLLTHHVLPSFIYLLHFHSNLHRSRLLHDESPDRNQIRSCCRPLLTYVTVPSRLNVCCMIGIMNWLPPS